tara:strand:+ start:1175 stop:1936 length:762 start_codon:yes stop_codon:yes gene_type:complete
MKKIITSRFIWIGLILTVILLGSLLNAQGIPSISIGMEESTSPQDFSLTIKIIILMTILSLAPSIIIMMTSFTRIIIVFHFLRAALGTQSAPSNQILVGLALFITYFIMSPVIDAVNENALQPYMDGRIEQDIALSEGIKPVKAFMLSQVNEKSLNMFIEYYPGEKPKNEEELSMVILIPAFILSELTIAFKIGFLLYMPMLLLDMVIASILMSMGMMMLPPVIISMPFKIMLFVIVDGWNLIVESVVTGIRY